MNRRHPPPKLPLLLLLLACCHRYPGFRCDAFSPPTGGRRTPRRPRASSSLSSSREEDRGRGVVVVAPPRGTDEGGGDAAATNSPGAWIVQWRGEGTEGYSEALRELEFASSFRAEMSDRLTLRTSGAANDHDSALLDMNRCVEDVQFLFRDALTYRGPVQDCDGDENRADANTNNAEREGEPIPFSQVRTYESAVQYVGLSLPSGTECARGDTLSTAGLGEIFESTVRRCSLVRTAFRIVAEGESYERLAAEALANESFDDMMEGGINEDATWSIRLRRYGATNGEAAPNGRSQGSSSIDSVGGDADDVAREGAKKSKRHARYGKNVRSPLRDERNAILSMGELAKLLRGRVDLANPECGIYLLEGLNRRDVASDRRDDVALERSAGRENGEDGDGARSKILLARVIARGPKTSIYAPKTRICVTTTPLCPIASFALCNAARLRRRGTPAILDPFAGSCATLLAAAHITSLPTSPSERGCRSVAIEIAHNGYVNRDDIVRDFVARSLPPPLEIIRGDCLSPEVRDEARGAIGGGAFDAIVTDPPYGIREAMVSCDARGNSEGDANGSGGEDSTPAISPLAQLFHAMGRDRANGTPLLKSGGRLAAFVPVRKGERLEECLPDLEARREAGLVMEGEGKEQVLSDILSRWLVTFVCL